MVSRAGRVYASLRSARNRLILAGKRLPQVHRSSYVNPTATVARDLQAAEYVYIGPRCCVSPRVVIGRYTMLAPNVAIVGDDHNMDQSGVPMQFAGRPRQRLTRIGADVWIGQAAIVLRGVSIGDGAVVAAGSILTRSVPAFEVWAGVPTRKIRDRFESSLERRQHAEMLAGPVTKPSFAEPLTS